MDADRNAVRKKAVDERTTKVDVMLRALEDQDVNEWEKGFLSSVSDWFYMKQGNLSERQYETLEKIYRRFY